MEAHEARKIVEQEFNLDISVRSRKRRYVAARTVYYHICIKFGERLTYEKFTEEIGYQHSTVINAMTKLYNMLSLKQWEFMSELKTCEDRAILLSISADAAHVKAFDSIEAVNKKFKRDLYIMVANYTKVISQYEAKLKQQKIEYIKLKEELAI